MYPKMYKSILKNKIIPKIGWDIIIDSSKVGLQKPDPEIYVLAEKLAEAKGEEIFFVENTKVNIDTAKSLGWQTFLYDSNNYEKSSQELLEYFNEAEKSQI